MGVAILSILLTHLNCDLGSFALNRLALCCQGGVDAFFFMSGFGLYYSAQKGHSTLTFYKRRALRIFPPFLCLFATMMLIQHNFTWQRAFWGGTTLAYWFPATRQYMFGWFVSVIVLLYAAFPAYSRWFAAQRKLATATAVATGLALTSIYAVYFMVLHPGGYNQYILAAARMPIFFIGIYAAWLLQQPCTKLRRNKSRRIMHYLGTIQHGNQPIRFHDHAQHRTALSAIQIDCARRLRIIRTVVPQNGKAPHYPFPSQNVATCRAMHTRGISANRHNLSLQHNSSPKPRHLQSYSKDFNSYAYAAVSMGHSHLHKIHHEQNTIKP